MNTVADPALISNRGGGTHGFQGGAMCQPLALALKWL